MNRAMVTALCAGVVVSSFASAGQVTSFRDELGTQFFPGNGNDNVNFAISRFTEASGNVVELGLKAKERFFGDANVAGVDNVYIVQPGFSPTSGAAGAPDDTSRAWWNFDFSADYGTRSNADTLVTMTIQDIDGDVFMAPFLPAPPDFPVGASLAQGSWNIGFDFLDLALGGFDPFQTGDYEITLAAQDIASGDALGSVGITVRVVPAPGAFALLGMGGLVTARRRR